MPVPTTKSSRSSAILNGHQTSRKSESYNVASVSKALELLVAFSVEMPVWALSDLARRLEVPKSTAHNLLQTLKQFDLVRQDTETRLYRIGPRAMELGLLFAKSSRDLAHVRPVLRRLLDSTGETCKYGMLSGGQVVIVAALESGFQLHTRGDIGTRWDLHSTSLGKAILAALPDEEAQEVLELRGMPKHTALTISTWPEMLRELNAIRERGYALDLEENELGVRCVAAAAADPLRGTVAAMSVSGPRDRVPDERIHKISGDVLAAVRAVSLSTREG